MCDYCDCRSQPEIQALSDEHEAILAVVGGLRRAGDRAAIAGGLDTLEALLRPHTRREEAGIFTQLHPLVAPGYVGRFRVDHDRIDDLLAAAREGRAPLGAFLDVLQEHILEEETDMYPAARQMLGAVEWDAIDRTLDAIA